MNTRVLQRRFWLAMASIATLASPARASASLTATEEGMVKGFVAEGRVQDAARVRALVARPDLSPDEAAASLTVALVPLPFIEARQAFFRELLFGGASAASRPTLVVAVVRALLARAQGLLSTFGADLDARSGVLLELSSLYGFMAAEIADAGQPGAGVHDPTTGITPAAYDACLSALAEHRQKNLRWLRADTPLSLPAARVRAQFQWTLYRMTNDVPRRRRVAADRLGLAGARRALLIDLGVLEMDAGQADDERVENVRARLVRFGPDHGAATGLQFGDGYPALRGHGVVRVGVGLEVPPVMLFVDSPAKEAPTLDLPLFMLTYELSRVRVARAFAARSDLRAVVLEDVRKLQARAHSQLSVEQEVARTMAALVTDAPRTLDAAFAGWLDHRPEAMALVSDALGAWAAGALREAGDDGTEGVFEPPLATSVHVAGNGLVTAFALGRHRWEVRRDGMGRVEAVRREEVAREGRRPRAVPAE